MLISIALLVIVCGTDTLHVGTCSQGFIPNFPFTQFWYDSDIEWLYMRNLKTVCCPSPSDCLPKSSWQSTLSQLAISNSPAMYVTCPYLAPGKFPWKKLPCFCAHWHEIKLLFLYTVTGPCSEPQISFICVETLKVCI